MLVAGRGAWGGGGVGLFIRIWAASANLFRLQSRRFFEVDECLRLGTYSNKYGIFFQIVILSRNIRSFGLSLQREPSFIHVKIRVTRFWCSQKSCQVLIDIFPTGKNCEEFFKAGCNISGVYNVKPDHMEAFEVFCEMKDGEVWTVIQRRNDGSVDFFRGWKDYQKGFGNLSGEFWLGNDKIHRLTASVNTSLHVELEDWDQNKAYAKYGHFNVADLKSNYRLSVGSYSGTAGDSLARTNSKLYNHNGMSFTTRDRDNDKYQGINCAQYEKGAWWYNACAVSNLNGQYLGKGRSEWTGVWWYSFRETLSLKFTQMKLGTNF